MLSPGRRNVSTVLPQDGQVAVGHSAIGVPPIPGVEELELAGGGVADEVAVGAVDLLQARAHPPGEGEEVDAGGDRVGRIGVAEVVDALVGDAGGGHSRLPDSGAEPVEVCELALRGG